MASLIAKCLTTPNQHATIIASHRGMRITDMCRPLPLEMAATETNDSGLGDRVTTLQLNCLETVIAKLPFNYFFKIGFNATDITTELGIPATLVVTLDQYRGHMMAGIRDSLVGDFRLRQLTGTRMAHYPGAVGNASDVDRAVWWCVKRTAATHFHDLPAHVHESPELAILGTMILAKMIHTSPSLSLSDDVFNPFALAVARPHHRLVEQYYCNDILALTTDGDKNRHDNKEEYRQLGEYLKDIPILPFLYSNMTGWKDFRQQSQIISKYRNITRKMMETTVTRTADRPLADWIVYETTDRTVTTTKDRLEAVCADLDESSADSSWVQEMETITDLIRVVRIISIDRQGGYW